MCRKPATADIFMGRRGSGKKDHAGIWSGTQLYKRQKASFLFKCRAILKNINFIDEVLNEKMNFVIQEV